MTAYNDDKVYSVELVGAVRGYWWFNMNFLLKVQQVLRQGSFVEKMYDLGWTRPGYFDGQEDELALHHALARYHAYVLVVLAVFLCLRDNSFLDLTSSSPASFFVPTLDIDLVWHTHQLMPEKYSSDCEEYLKRFIDQ